MNIKALSVSSAKCMGPVSHLTKFCRPSVCCGARLCVAAPVSLLALPEMRFWWAAPGLASSVRQSHIAVLIWTTIL